MSEFQRVLQESLIWTEGLAAIIFIIFYKNAKDSYWKYFSIYLIVMFLSEVFGKWGGNLIEYSKPIFFNYFVIPIEFLFLYWLYASKTFKKPNYFILYHFFIYFPLFPMNISSGQGK